MDPNIEDIPDSVPAAPPIEDPDADDDDRKEGEDDDDDDEDEEDPGALPFLQNEQLAEYKMAFDMVDTDGDGIIKTHEFADTLHILGYYPTEAEVRDMISAEVDWINGDVNFIMATKIVSENIGYDYTDQELLQAWKVFDCDNKGFITQERFIEIAKSLGDTITEDEVTEMMKQIDLDGDGKVTFDNIVLVMRQQEYLVFEDNTQW